MQKIIIASGPVIIENKQVLLNKHGDTPFWKFCGGRVEDFDVDLIECAKREVKEEMGIDIHQHFATSQITSAIRYHLRFRLSLNRFA